jgi:oligosaccharide repeat unit polymerase
MLWFTSNIDKKYSLFWRKPIELDNRDTRASVKFIFILAAAVTVFYYSKVGYNVFLNIILGITIEDYSTLRLASYSGENYYAAGYVNQFKNVLLPVSLSIICVWKLLQGHKKQFYFAAFFGSIFCLIALLGTGQRAFLAYSAVSLFFGIAALKELKLKSIAIPSITIFFIFSMMSSFYKVDSIKENENIVLQSSLKTLERVFYTEQEGSLTSFEYMYTQDNIYMTEIFDQIRGIFPGQKGSFLEHHLFSLRHGTTRGTETYSTAGGFYYNGGLLGVFACFVILAFSHFYIFYRFLCGKRSVLRIFVYAAIIFYTSKLVSGGILTIINSGVLTLFILLLLSKFKYNLSKIGVKRISN